MFTKTYSATLKGIEANLIGIEIDAAQGVPGFNIVGLADKSINEARERITVAMRACEFELLPKRILVNLSPAHIRKEGAQLDLAIAIGLMVNFGYVKIGPRFIDQFCFIGELSLTGDIKAVKGTLALASECQKSDIKYLIIPKANADEASLMSLMPKFETKIFAVENLSEVKELIEALYHLRQAKFDSKIDSKNLEELISNYQIHKLDKKKFYSANIKKPRLDFNDVIGQNHAKRGLEIAAAGNHHLLMIGPPGCGKSMLAKRFKHLLPPLSFNQALEVTKIYSICGILKNKIMLESPMRSPHHSASAIALVGGGSQVQPGEVSLAHNGILFLDELTEFSKHTIEHLRQILDEKEITINRIKQSLTYPADFTLVAACNPCPCGYRGDPEKSCGCTPLEIKRYFGKLSGPLLDRIDLHLELPRLSKDEISMLSQKTISNEKSKNSLTMEIKSKVKKAREFSQAESLGPKLDNKARKLLDHAVFNLKLSARSHQKITKIARTIANLAESPEIQEEHIAEAMLYRQVDWEKYR